MKSKEDIESLIEHYKDQLDDVEYMDANYIIGNRRYQGIANLPENDMIDIENCITEKIHEDWNKLKEKLTEQNIPYQFGIGVFRYTY